MIATPGHPRLRRLTLLMGLLLHLIGVAAVPFHVWSPAGAAPAGAVVAERHDEGSSLPAHDELHCVLCHAAGTLALPSDGAQILPIEAAGRAETPAPRQAAAFHPASPARARAPPIA